TNYAVGFDTMDTRKYRDFSQYVEHVKTLTSQMAPGVVFGAEQDQTIGDNKFHIIEASFNQVGVDFQTLIAVIPGNNNDVWTITFNTPKSQWENYQEIFNKILKSFKLK
ncbi:MAG: PsbP-related protein, partial [Candidatus Parcubacteria bacterium]|nr:PsbP-related protein [Candidatus Parcubacteria bacterium]